MNGIYRFPEAKKIKHSVDFGWTSKRSILTFNNITNMFKVDFTMRVSVDFFSVCL